MDRARKKTDRELKIMERKINEVYSDSLALRRIGKKYTAYMERVAKQTEASYRAYKAEKDEKIKKELKKAYMDEIKRLTVNNKEYKALMNEIAEVMAEVNQKALDIPNAKMAEIYAINYNQISVDCRKIGIRVNGKTDL